MPLKIVIAPQSFKGSTSAMEAAKAIERGVLAAEPDAETVLVPVADGGDGTLDALVDSTGGRLFRSVVTGPLSQPLEATWGVMGDGRTYDYVTAMRASLVEEGYGYSSYYPPDIRHYELLLALELSAEEVGVGLWGVCQ
ncbi:MAG: glycerate kinase [Chloroflexi bacterium]|nr:glycerate kinase [Chloroflexota bacterium]